MVKFPTRILSEHLSAISVALAVCAILLPRFAQAQVVISEFLYDAPGSDTDQEWMELFNAGASAVDLTKWKINDGSNHVLNVPPKNNGKGSITINAGEYIILAADAATFIAQYPNVANVIDTTLALPNTSGTISLVDEEGVTVDTFAYTKDQGAAGNGNTFQRGAVGAATFAAASPTPGTGSLASEQTDQNTDTDSDQTATTTESVQTTTTTSSSASTPVSSYVPPPLPEIFADGGPDRLAIVGADIEFNGRAYNRNQVVLDKVRFVWNFGDGSTAEGQSVLHHFDYPGRYAVSLDIAHERNAALDMIIVTAEPARLAFSALSDGSVAIENKAGKNLDLSLWIVRNFSQTFMLPEHSIVLAGTTFHISQKTLGFWSSASTELEYPNGVLAFRAGAEESAPSQATTPAGAQAQVVHAPSSIVAPITYADPQIAILEVTDEGSSTPEEISLDTTFVPTSSQVGTAEAATPSSPLWWFLLLGLAALSSFALITARLFRKGEWDIVEDKSE